jgi:hypothetical protein
MRIPAIITNASITLTGPDFVPRAIPASHPNFEQIRECLERGCDWNDVKDLVDLPSAIVTYTKGRIKVVDDELFFDEQPVHNALAGRILNLISDKMEATAQPLINFMEKVHENPSMRAVEGLYEWLEKANLPITEDGDFIAWKIVREDYRDIYTGRFDNSIGSVVEVARNAVDEDPDRTCSSGLHFCSSGYLPHYGTSSGSRVVVVKIHPRDVVAFPRDYNTAKGRACRYEVIGEVDREAAPEMFRGINVLRDFGTMSLNPSVAGNVEVDGVYLTREGTKVLIVEDTGHDEYPFKGDNGASYSPDGEYLTGTELPQDLVKRLA